MFKNYFTIAVRHLFRHKLFSLINILCLSLGITFSMIIGVYVIQQKEINSDIKNIGNQYLIKSKWKQSNMGEEITTLGPLAKTMRDEFPALVANYYRFDPVTNIVSVDDKHFREDISVGDTTLISMFGFPLLYGDPQRAFINDQSAVVTEDFARKYFGTADVINKVISIQTPADGGKHSFTISAVLKKMPFNSISNFAVAKTEYQVYLPMFNNQYFQGGDKGDNWANIFMAGMIQLQKGVQPKDLDKPFQQTLAKYQPDFVKGNLIAELVPMKTYQLESNNGAIQKMIYTLSLVAAFILILAIINFININIGTSSYRLKEIGLRKVFGSARLQLIIQFITESLMLSFIALIISMAAYQLLLPLFNSLLQTSLHSIWQFDISIIIFLVSLIIIVGLLAGIYPAFILSSYNTANSVKGKTDQANGSTLLRKVLLVVQFSLAIAVFICTWIVSEQVSFVFNKDVGYNKDQVMIISSIPRNWDSSGIINMERIKTQFQQIPEIKNISLSYDIPNGSGGYINVYSGSDHFVSMQLIGADNDYAKVYEIPVKEGKFLSNNYVPKIPAPVVLNETAVNSLHIDNPVGKTIYLGAANGFPITIAGVVKDYNYETLQKTISPLVIASLNEPFTRSYRYFSVKLNSQNINGAIESLQKKWKVLFPDAGFEYSFMDEKFQAMYSSEMQLKKAAGIATILNLIIVFMGIFGVVAFTINKRSKEIAVRKVLGAEVRTILLLFVKDYVWLIIIANIIAWPVSYIVTNKWLQNYSYRMQQHLAPYIIVCLCVFILAIVLITAQCFKTAVSNPVKSLRTE
ncbi:MAG TPA: ABC transporter permease [Puia sp.]|nr:ABC transporter permease [Puia sp.]